MKQIIDKMNFIYFFEGSQFRVSYMVFLWRGEGGGPWMNTICVNFNEGKMLFWLSNENFRGRGEILVSHTPV